MDSRRRLGAVGQTASSGTPNTLRARMDELGIKFRRKQD